MKKRSMSVVIATFNRCETLKTTLLKLRSQSLSCALFDVLVIDDGSNDETSAVVVELQRDSPYDLTYLRHENRGPGYTQNCGIKSAKGHLVLLLADDIHASPQLLDEHLKFHKEHPEENIALLGKVIQSSDLPQTVFHQNWNPFRYDRLAGKTELESTCFFACNISLKRHFLLENGLFIERQGAAHEDIELGFRLGEKGMHLFYNESAIAYHYHEENLEGACRRAYERGWNFDLLSENIPKGYILPKYSILSLEAGIKECFKMLPREFFRSILFNRITVSKIWIPVITASESNKWAALLVNSFSMRGTVNYHLRQGFYDKRNEPTTTRI